MIIIAYPATRCAGAGAVAVVFWMTYAPLLSKLRDRVSERLSKLIAAMMIAIGIGMILGLI